MNLTTLRDLVVDFANRRGLFSSSPTTAQLNESMVTACINAGIRQVTTLFDFRACEASQDYSIIANADYALPADFASAKYLMHLEADLDPVGKLYYVPPETFDQITTSGAEFLNMIFMIVPDDAVGIFTIYGSYIRLKPRPTANSTDLLRLYYMKFLPDLSASGDTNYFTDNYPMLCVYGGLKHLTHILQVRQDSTVIDDIGREFDNWMNIVTAKESLSRSREVIPLSTNFGKVSISG